MKPTPRRTSNPWKYWTKFLLTVLEESVGRYLQTGSSAGGTHSKAALSDIVWFFHIVPLSLSAPQPDTCERETGCARQVASFPEHSRFLFSSVCKYFKSFSEMSFSVALLAAETTLGSCSLQRKTNQQQKAVSEARHLLAESPLYTQMPMESWANNHRGFLHR